MILYILHEPIASKVVFLAKLIVCNETYLKQKKIQKFGSHHESENFSSMFLNRLDKSFCCL